VCDKGSIDLARTYGSDSCSVVLHRLNIRNHAREFGFHLMRFTAFLVVHENAHCKHDESERPSVHAEAVIAKRIGDPALIARARCDSAAIGRDGGWDTDHNGEVQREC
jgi:hypothetical protein